jgi:hypothetical protein
MDRVLIQPAGRLAKIFTDAEQLPGVIEIATNVVAVRERIGVDLSFLRRSRSLLSREGADAPRFVELYLTTPLRLADPARR